MNHTIRPNRMAALVIAFLLLSAIRTHAEVIALIGVNVLPMDTERELLGQTVIVRDGIIESIEPIAEGTIPSDAHVIYGRGRWLVPGLVDMHVHVRAADLGTYIRYGVTTVRDLAGLDSVLAARGRVERGEVIGPRIFVASMLMTGPSPQNPTFSAPVARASDATSAVNTQLARGCDSIKLYDGLSRETYDALVAAARLRDVKIAGHVTRSVEIRHAITMQDSIEHLSGYPLGDPLVNLELAEASRESGVWNCPTMTVFTEYVTLGMDAQSRAQLLADRRRLLEALHVAGARVLAGTDAGYLVPAGRALHDELEELVAAGFSPFAALTAATRSASEYLDEPIGTVTPGARADLILVPNNPLNDLHILRSPDAVMIRGRWLAYGEERRRAVRR